MPSFRVWESVWVALVCALAACGDDGSAGDGAAVDARPIDAPAVTDAPPPDMAIDAPPITCPVGGAVSGTVAGEGFTQVTTTVGFGGPTIELIVVEEAATCEEPPAAGEFLDIQVCGDAAPGTYTIQPGAGLECGAGSTAAVVFFGTLEQQTFATGGTVTLTVAANDCYSGTFDAQFAGGDAMTGSFDVSLCR